MQTVLVTGGAGFIGSHLVEEYLKREMISENTYHLCSNDEYENLDLIMKGVLACKNWIGFIYDDLPNLY